MFRYVFARSSLNLYLQKSEFDPASDIENPPIPMLFSYWFHLERPDIFVYDYYSISDSKWQHYCYHIVQHIIYDSCVVGAVQS